MALGGVVLLPPWLCHRFRGRAANPVPLELQARCWLLGVTSGSPSSLVPSAYLVTWFWGVGASQSSVSTSAGAKDLVWQTVIPQQRTRVKALQQELHLLQEDRPNCNLVHHPHRYFELEYLTCAKCTLSSLYWPWCSSDYLVKKHSNKPQLFFQYSCCHFYFCCCSGCLCLGR